MSQSGHVNKYWILSYWSQQAWGRMIACSSCVTSQLARYSKSTQLRWWRCAGGGFWVQYMLGAWSAPVQASCLRTARMSAQLWTDSRVQYQHSTCKGVDSMQTCLTHTAVPKRSQVWKPDTVSKIEFAVYRDTHKASKVLLLRTCDANAWYQSLRYRNNTAEVCYFRNQITVECTRLSGGLQTSFAVILLPCKENIGLWTM